MAADRRTAGTLGLAPAATEEEPVAVAGLAAEGPMVGEGLAEGGVGPWRTRGLKE